MDLAEICLLLPWNAYPSVHNKLGLDTWLPSAAPLSAALQLVFAELPFVASAMNSVWVLLLPVHPVLLVLEMKLQQLSLVRCPLFSWLQAFCLSSVLQLNIIRNVVKNHSSQSQVLNNNRETANQIKSHARHDYDNGYWEWLTRSSFWFPRSCCISFSNLHSNIVIQRNVTFSFA